MKAFLSAGTTRPGEAHQVETKALAYKEAERILRETEPGTEGWGTIPYPRAGQPPPLGLLEDEREILAAFLAEACNAFDAMGAS